MFPMCPLCDGGKNTQSLFSVKSKSKSDMKLIRSFSSQIKYVSPKIPFLCFHS